MKKRNSSPKQRTLWFSTEGQTRDGTTKHFRVYREGGAIEIVGPNLYRYPCPPSRKDQKDVEMEIALVFDVKIKKDE